MDHDVGLGRGSQSTEPEQAVALGRHEPEALRFETNDDRIVDDAAMLVGDEDVRAFADRAAREIARDSLVEELQGSWAAHLDRDFGADVPEGDALEQGTVFIERVAVQRGKQFPVEDRVGTRVMARRPREGDGRSGPKRAENRHGRRFWRHRPLLGRRATRDNRMVPQWVLGRSRSGTCVGLGHSLFGDRSSSAASRAWEA